MNERRTNEEREALVAGDRSDALEPEEAAELALLADVLADASTWAEPDAGLEDAVVQAVAAAGTAPLAEPLDAIGARRTAAVARRQAPRWRRVTLAAVAVAAAIAIALGVVVATRGGANPDYKAKLEATGLAPGSHASADITHNAAGFRITLDAHGLPPLRPGEYYQAWLKSPANVLVPIGTFSSSDARVTLWSGVSPRDFPTITVTIEAADNNQASSGRRVLTGVVHAG